MKDLTPQELEVLVQVAQSVEECLQYDDLLEAYSDEGRFVMSLTEEEVTQLRNAIKKLN